MVTIPKGVTESGEGFTKFPDGTLIQWGRESVQAGVQKITVNFKERFVNSNVSVSACPVYLTDSRVFITHDSTDYKLGVAFYITDNEQVLTQNRAFRWIVIGRWK